MPIHNLSFENLKDCIRIININKRSTSFQMYNPKTDLVYILDRDVYGNVRIYISSSAEFHKGETDCGHIRSLVGRFSIRNHWEKTGLVFRFIELNCRRLTSNNWWYIRNEIHS